MKHQAPQKPTTVSKRNRMENYLIEPCFDNVKA